MKAKPPEHCGMNRGEALSVGCELCVSSVGLYDGMPADGKRESLMLTVAWLELASLPYFAIWSCGLITHMNQGGH